MGSEVSGQEPDTGFFVMGEGEEDVWSQEGRW
jgi:hypothetical protein